MSPVRKEVYISSMVTMDMNMVILLGAIACSLVVGVTVSVVAYYCLVIKRRRKVKSPAHSQFVTTPRDTSNSYIHYGSPGNSVRPLRKSKKTSSQRKPSEYSVYSNASMSDTDQFTSFQEDSTPKMMWKDALGQGAEEKEVENRDVEEEHISQALNTCNLSSNLSELGLTGSSGPTTLQITASTSLCEQCLSPPPSPPPMLGTSISLPPTTVEMTKTVLGMTNPVSDHPIVCDTCLSPSKLGETTRSLNLPGVGFETDLRQRRLSPSGIVTNPRMKNQMLTTLRENMSTDLLATLVNMDIDDTVDKEARDIQENSFDSLLSPSKACDWFSSDPFELSDGEGSSPEDPRMEKIKPVITAKSARHDQRGRSEDSSVENYLHSKPSSVKRSSCHEDPRKGILSPPLRNQAVLPELTKNIISSARMSKTSSPSSATPLRHHQSPCQFLQHTPLTPPLYSPVISHKFPLVPPPSPFQSPCLGKDTLSAIVSAKNKTIVTITPDKPPLIFQFPGPGQNSTASVSSRRHSSTSVQSTPVNSPKLVSDTKMETDLLHESVSKGSLQVENHSYLAWDSTFEAVKTLEGSMKLDVTPLHKKAKEPYEDSPHDSNDSQISVCPEEKSIMSIMSLTWDNTGDTLAETTSPQSHNSSMQSLDIDEIIGRVAPNLLEQDDCVTESKPRISKLQPVLTIPFLKRSVTSIDMDALLDMEDEESSCETPLVQEGEHSSSQPLPFYSPTVTPHATLTPVFEFPPYTHTRDHSLHQSSSSSLGNHMHHIQHGSSLLSAQPTSPHSCVSEDFLSTCGSMESFTTAFEL